MTCKTCGADLGPGSYDYCNLTCELEYKNDDLRQQLADIRELLREHVIKHSKAWNGQEYAECAECSCWWWVDETEKHYKPCRYAQAMGVRCDG